MKDAFPPGLNSGLLGLTNAIRYKLDPLGFLRDAVNRYGDVAPLQIGSNFIYLLHHPKFVKQVFLDNWSKFGKPDLIKVSNRGYWGDGLTSLEGQPWERRRRLIKPAFHQDRITTFARSIVSCTQDIIECWQAHAIINVDEVMLTLTARIAAKILFDAELEGHESKAITKTGPDIIHFKEAIGVDFRVSQNGDDFSSTSLIRRRAGQDMASTLKIIQDRFDTAEDRGDMVSFLVNATYEDGSQMTYEELVGEIMQMFFAGHHTIPTTLIWLWYALSQHSELEAQVHEELDRVLEERPPRAEDLPHLPYNEMIVKETLRYYSPTVALVREAKEDVQVGEYILNKGATVWISPYLLHRDPRFFENPERFWPERFTKERARRIPKYAYIPFGTGPRICIGQALSLMQIRLILATVAQKYRLVLPPGQSIKPTLFLTMRPDKEMYMQVIPRSKKPNMS
jgi:cytochrome P450